MCMLTSKQKNIVADSLKAVIAKRNAVTAFDIRSHLRRTGMDTGLDLNEVGPCLREWWNTGNKIFNGFACKKAADDSVPNASRALIFFKVPKSCQALHTLDKLITDGYKTSAV